MRAAVHGVLLRGGVTWASLTQTLQVWLPTGGTLSKHAWWERHRVCLALLWLHAFGLALFGIVVGYGIPHSLGEAGLIAAAAVPAGAGHLSRRVRTAAATLGLLTASALLVHLTNGLIEAHFHFFVVLAVIALYQDWVPFLLGIGFVVLEHGTVGVLHPHQVYDHAEAWSEPWKWALIHGGFVLALCAAMVAQWRFAERTQAERRQAALAQARLAAIVTSSDDAIISSDLEGRVTSWNAGATRLFGYTRTEMVGQPLRATLVPVEWQDHVRTALTRVQGGAPGLSLELPTRTKTGSLVEVGVSVSPLHDETGALVGWSCIARDVTQRKRAEAALEHQALHDALTQLPNRVLLRQRVDQAVARAEPAGQSTALLVLDLDRFKEVNDALGHEHGDRLLRELAARLARGLPAPASIARLGGDEFAVLLPTADLDEARRQAEALIAAVGEPFLLEGYRVEAGVSIGIALAPEHGTDFETLFRHADVAMYVAKREVKGWAVYAAEQDVHGPERLRLVGELRQAIEADALMLHYQPKFECSGGRITGVEALLRWPDPQRGMIPPDHFIPLAEQTGLIRPLTQWVIRTALRQARSWRDHGLVLPVAVNLSTRNLHETDLVQAIQQALATWQLPTSALELEITESGLMAHPERAQAVLAELSQMGIRVAVDDFGTGYSSLAYLKDLTVHELKIDRSFVADMWRQTRSRAIVQSTIDLAHHLGLRVVAEGVEDQATWELLGRLGCDVAQGYYLSRPGPAASVVDGQWQGPVATPPLKPAA